MAKKLYVGNLSYDTTSDGLRAAFEAVGPVATADVISDRYSGRSRGFGFVEMASDSDANSAVERLNGTSLDGRTITVAEARPRENRDDRGGRSGGGRSNDWGGGGGGRW
ncbi:MAG: RNA-binding protein [Chloroflexi bacterium]|nr:RNA-binding protein [Chloroflexota bacterium]